MSSIGEKIRAICHNREWTQKELAMQMQVEPTTVQKWIVGKNMPAVETIKKLCEVLYVPIEELTDDDFDIPEYYVIDRYLPYNIAQRPEEYQDTEHTLIEAYLAQGAILHRFTNAGGEECSAIYLHRKEVWWHYRDKEAQMIRDWNREYAK